MLKSVFCLIYYDDETFIAFIQLRQDRAGSPAESILSVTSHMPVQYLQNNGGSSSRLGASHSSTRASNNNASTSKRSRQSNNNHINPSPVIVQERSNLSQDQANYASNSNPRKELFNAPPSSSSSHPSLPLPYGQPNGIQVYDLTHTISNGTDWAVRPAAPGQLEGPGMPVARGQSHGALSSLSALAAPSVVAGGGPIGSGTSVTEGTPADGGDGDGDGDDKTYCFCEGISYGEMIACDDDACEREWVRPFFLI